jgi:hypothetical protein
MYIFLLGGKTGISIDTITLCTVPSPFHTMSFADLGPRLTSSDAMCIALLARLPAGIVEHIEDSRKSGCVLIAELQKRYPDPAELATLLNRWLRHSSVARIDIAEQYWPAPRTAVFAPPPTVRAAAPPPASVAAPGAEEETPLHDLNRALSDFGAEISLRDVVLLCKAAGIPGGRADQIERARANPGGQLIRTLREMLVTDAAVARFICSNYTGGVSIVRLQCAT